MGVNLYGEPVLQKPVLIAGWPGIANIGLVAVDSLRRTLKAEEFGEIEPWDFLYPKKVVIKDGILESLEFPANRFYFARTDKGDLIIFLGEEQPTEFGRTYAEGKKAYQMANLVLDVAQKFGCQRVYTSGAAVAPTHHTVWPRVWAVPNRKGLIREIRDYRNTILMSEIEGRGKQGSITGLNGLLLGVAAKRNIDAVCVMGEIPVYLQGFPMPYPRASRAVVEVLRAALNLSIDTGELDAAVERSDREIDEIYGSLPSEVREQLDRLKSLADARPAEPGPITEEDKNKIMEEVDRFFKRENQGDQS